MSVSDGDFEIDKNNKGDISQISQTVMWFPIIRIVSENKHQNHLHDVKSESDYKSEGDYKTEGDCNIGNWRRVYDYTQKCDYR